MLSGQHSSLNIYIVTCFSEETREKYIYYCTVKKSDKESVKWLVLVFPMLSTNDAQRNVHHE